MIVAASLLAADPARFGDDILAAERAGARYLHIDVMDGVFVPNISFGPGIVAGLRRVSSMFFDVHLMVAKPEPLIGAFISAGADSITLHIESSCAISRIARDFKKRNVRFGVALSPKTEISQIAGIINEIDILLLMSVTPGFGGQTFMNETVSRIAEVKRLRERAGAKFLISVDGGINEQTAWLCEDADILVSGSYIFKAADKAAAVAALSR